jgi:hypothetical protein
VIIEAQFKFILSAITTALRKDITKISLDPTRFVKYNRRIQAALKKTVWNSGCTSYFLDKSGRNTTNWPWTTFRMRRLLGRFAMQDFVTETRKP